MNKLLDKLFTFDKTFSKEEYKAGLDAIALKAGSRPTRGNIALQNGAVLSKEKQAIERDAFIKNNKISPCNN